MIGRERVQRVQRVGDSKRRERVQRVGDGRECSERVSDKVGAGPRRL